MMTTQEKLKKKAIISIFYLIAKRIFLQIVFTVSNVILARILFPEDFGIFAIIGFVTVFFSVFADLGLTPAIVQKKSRLTDKDVQTVFTIQMSLSFLIILLIYIVSPTISAFYQLGEKGVFLFRLYSLTFLFLPIRNILGAVLERNLDFKRLVLIELLGAPAISVITVILAYLEFGVTSFVLGAVLGGLIWALFYIFLTNWRPALIFSKASFLSLVRFGIPYQTNVVFGLFYGPLILLYLGKVVGSVNLGYFQFAASVSVMPMSVAEIVSKVVFPLGSRLQEDREVLKKITEQAIMVISATTLPIVFIGIASVSSIVHFIYTDKWLPALPAVYLGLVQTGIMSFTGIFGYLLLARGHAKTIRNMGIVWAALTWILGPVLIHFFNFVGMSATALLVSASGVWLIFRLKREVEFAFWRNFYPFLVSAVSSGVIVLIANNFLPESLIGLVLMLILGVSCYLGMICYWRYQEIFENLKMLIGAVRGV